MRRDAALLNWMMPVVLFGLLVLLALALVRWGAAGRDGGSYIGVQPPPLPHAAADQARQFFGWPASVKWTPLTQTNNPFFTLAIQPVPPPKPPPPPPATRKVELTYRGFLETSAGVRRAVVQVADQQVIGLLGDRVVADYATSEIALRHLTLTNVAGTNVTLEFSRPQSLEIPAK